MVGTIFQLSGALMLGYEVAIRSKGQSISDATMSGGRWSDKSTRDTAKKFVSYDELYKTYAYRIGFTYLILGYILPLFIEESFENIPTFFRGYLVIWLSAVLLLVSIEISRVLAKSAFEKEIVKKKN